jgi:hypothetical protein
MNHGGNTSATAATATAAAALASASGRAGWNSSHNHCQWPVASAPAPHQYVAVLRTSTRAEAGVLRLATVFKLELLSSGGAAVTTQLYV